MMLGMDMMGGGRRLPRNGLLLYLARPNSDEYLVGEDTEVGEDTYIWGYVLPDDADIRAATGWVNGAANVFYTSTGVPIVALATEIAAAILPANVVFSLIDATTQTGKLAIYTATTTEATLAKARSVLRDESINYLFYGRTVIVYDPQDPTTLFQDAAGTLPVYRPGTGLVDPPVGLMLDEGQGLELGPELVVNGDFSDGAEGWTANDSTLSVESGKLRVTTMLDYGRALQQIAVIAGKTYKVEASISIVSGNPATSVQFSSDLAFGSGTKVGDEDCGNTTRTVRFYWRAPATRSYALVLQNSSPIAAVNDFDGISVREIKGYHAYQSTATARPTLSGRYNQLDATETLSTQSVTTVATNYTLSFSGTGTVTLSGTATGTLSAGTHTITCTAGTLTLTVSGTVTRADLRRVTVQVLPVYQSVTNANTYDTAGFPLFLKRDKVDDDLIVQAPAITGAWAHGTLEGPIFGTVAIPAGEYRPFGIELTYGSPNCTQWIAINGTLSANEQLILERYVRAKSSSLISTNPFTGVFFLNDWFSGRTDISHLSCEDWNMSNITNCGSLFYGTRFSEIDVSRWDVSKCLNLASMFFNNTKIKIIDISSLDTSSVTDLASFARNCASLETLVLGSINTSKALNFRAFVTNSKITELDISSLDFSAVTGVPGVTNYNGLREFAAENPLLSTVIVGGAFDNTQTTNFMNAFTRTNLNQASIDAILVSINTAGTSNGTFDQSGGSAPSATGEAAITAMRSRGWTVTVTGGF